jgi:hypothetical protein
LDHIRASGDPECQQDLSLEFSLDLNSVCTCDDVPLW